MEHITIKTLIDITKPKVSRPGQGSELEQNQFKNWITLQQCIGLRSIIEYDVESTCESVDIKSAGFGRKYKGRQTVWTFQFQPDRSLAYDDSDGNMIGLLFADVNQVPVIKNLRETINIAKAVFDTDDPEFRNTIITAYHVPL